LFARELEARGRARVTVTRRLCTIAGFYKYAVEEELLDHSPAAHLRRPRLDYESHATALDRNELGAILVAAGLGPPAGHALISLLALNGLRVSEATGAYIEHLGLERGHRTLTVTRKGGKVVTIPLAPRTARAIDLAIGERTDGPVFTAGDGRRLDRHGAARIVRVDVRRAGSARSYRHVRRQLAGGWCDDRTRIDVTSVGCSTRYPSSTTACDRRTLTSCSRISSPSPAWTGGRPCLRWAAVPVRRHARWQLSGTR
jgi:integrase